MPKTLFVVDDSATMRTAFELTFVGEDVTVITHDGSEGALDRAREVRPDGVIVDVNLNGTPGYGLVRSMRQDGALASVPVLLLYSDFSPLDEASARACGAVGQVAKPFDTTALIDRVKLLFSSATATSAPAGERPSQTSPPPRGPVAQEPLARTPPAAAGAPARPAPTAARSFASTTVTTAVPPPAINRTAAQPPTPPMSPFAARSAPTPTAPAARVPTPPGPMLSLDANESELQLEPAILAELGAMPSAPLPNPPQNQFAPSPLRGATAPLGARLTPEPSAPRAQSTMIGQARQPDAPAQTFSSLGSSPITSSPPPLPITSAVPTAIAPVAPTPIPVPVPVPTPMPMTAPAPVAPTAHAPVAQPAPVAPAPVAPVSGPTASPASMAAIANAQEEISKKAAALGLSPAQVEAIAALTRDVVERVVWEVVPQLAETMIREEIRRLLSDDSTN